MKDVILTPWTPWTPWTLFTIAHLSLQGLYSTGIGDVLGRLAKQHFSAKGTIDDPKTFLQHHWNVIPHTLMNKDVRYVETDT